MALSALALAVVLTNAQVLTMDAAQPRATTLAVVDGKLAYVGDDVAAARKAAGAQAATLDCGGRTVMPGFDDAHVHFGLSVTLGSARGVDLPDLDKKGFIAAVKRASERLPDDDFLYVKTRTLPPDITAARHLDFLARPLFVVSAHGGLLNHAGLKRAGFTSTEAPDGFIRGRALSFALERLAQAIPMARLREAARGFFARLAALGITSVQLIDELPLLFEELRQRGELTARVRMIPLGFRFDTRLYQPSWVGGAPDWVRVDGVKYFHDDGARLPRYELESIFDVNVPAGRQVVVHVLSRRALQTLLDSLEKQAHAIGKPEALRLFRVEHADELGPREAERLARDGITVCANPSMLPEWHTASAFPLRTLLKAGVPLCLGTDWVGAHEPPRAIEPFESVQLAATHGGWVGGGTDERITVAEALEAYTAGSAAAEGQGDKKGRLRPGLFADLVVLSADPLATPVEELSSIRVLLTMVGGRVVHKTEELLLLEPGKEPPSIGPGTRRPGPPSIGPAKPAKSKADAPRR